MPFSAEGAYEQSPRMERVHQLIEEFREQLATHDYVVNPETEAVMALSGPPDLDESRNAQGTEENTARVEYAADVLKEVTAHRVGKRTDQVTAEDIQAHGPLLLLNGEIEQLPIMRELALEHDIPPANIRLIDCGHVGEANTRSHFTALNNDPSYKNLKHMSLVSSSYHAPRVARVALANSPETRNFDVVGVPTDRFQYDVYRKVRGEIRRILNYSEQGYFPADLPNKHNDTA